MTEMIEVPPGKGLLSVTDPDAGDLRTMWDKGNPDEVAAARGQFDELVKKKKYLAYRAVGKQGDQGEQIREFDPEAERIIFVKQNRGG